MRFHDTPRRGSGAQLHRARWPLWPKYSSISELAHDHYEATSPTEAISPRYPVCVEAIVVGLASVEPPLVIRDVSRRGMSLAFANYAAAIDPRRVAVGPMSRLTSRPILVDTNSA